MRNDPLCVGLGIVCEISAACIGDRASVVRSAQVPSFTRSLYRRTKERMRHLKVRR